MSVLRRKLSIAAAFGWLLLLQAGDAFAQPGSVPGRSAETTDASRMREDEEDERSSRAAQRTLDPAVALVLQKVLELQANKQEQAALAEVNKLIAERGERMKPYDKAISYQIRGSLKAGLEDYRGAIRDFETALATNGLDKKGNDQLRYFIAQLYVTVGEYAKAIAGLNEWIRTTTAAGEKVDPNAYYLLAAAYISLTPPDYRAARNPAELAVAGLPEPRKSYYDLLNLVYSELNDDAKRAPLLERMINYWPGERSYWTQLSGLYNQMGRDSDAFAVLEVAYRAGLLKTEQEILTLVQYFSFYENPYRGAKLLEREMEAGTVKRNVKNLQLLSQLWSQAREHKRAIPVLREAARQSNTGELSYRLGQVLLADEQYKAAEQALMAALNKGGMKQDDIADAWLLLGTARFSLAGPGDRPQRAKAREAFVRAANYSKTRSQANDWIRYIDEIQKVECLQDRLEWEQRVDDRTSDVERSRQALQVCRLQGRPATECAEHERRMREGQVLAERERANPPRCDRMAPAGQPASEQPASEQPAEDAPAEEEATAEGAEPADQ
jgi:tetratricopeptide (TPR) repeat protein